MRRASAAVALAFLSIAVAPSGLAHADPAGPTDYRSEIVEITPATDAIAVSIAGGDSFVVIDVAPGTEVLVLGYQGEHYLRIDAKGDVWENRRSPATYENTDRYGVGQLPAEADATAEPDWRRVGSGGTWAWHDHRAHRMEPFPPVNVARGEAVLDAVVPLVVDGIEVDVRVASTWMPAPSPWPTGAGIVLGLLLLAAAHRLRIVGMAGGLVMVAAAALAVGWVQYRSLPAATDPLWLWWVAPLIALIAATAAVVLHRRSRRRFPGRDVPDLGVLGATALASVQLLVWGIERRSGLTRAILPTDAPFWIDRLVTGAALAAGIVGAGVVIASVVRVLVPARAPARSHG